MIRNIPMFYSEDDIRDIVDDEIEWRDHDPKTIILPKRKRKPRRWKRKALYIFLWFLLSVFLCGQLSIGILPFSGSSPSPIVSLAQGVLLIGATLYLIINLIKD